MILYYITDRMQFPGDEASRRQHLLEKIREASECGVDFIQLREKDLPARELEALAYAAVVAVRKTSGTRLLINSRSDVALSSAADGVHLRSDDISPMEVRSLWPCHMGNRPVIGTSCHSPCEVERARAENADFAVFGPVFEKKIGNADQDGTGLDLLRQACAFKIPVLALGGVTLENARACVEAGAAGSVGIRLFQENRIVEVVRRLRN